VAVGTERRRIPPSAMPGGPVTQPSELDQLAVLKHIAEGAPLTTTLDVLALAIERGVPGARAVITLRRGEQVIAAAPSLTAKVAAALVMTSPDGDRAATAAQRGLLVAADTDPGWKQGAHAAAVTVGIRGCWSAPILGGQECGLGTLAVYLAEPRSPRPGELAVLDQARYLAAVAIRQHLASAEMTDLARLDPVTELANRDLAPDLRRSMAADELSLAYQPIVRLPASQLVRYEALLRWTSARGPVSPAAFVPVAERAGLGSALGRFVLSEALAALGRRRHCAPGAAVGLSINVTAHDLADDELVTTVAALLAQHRVPATTVTLEVTERALVRGGGAGWRTLRGLSDLGLRIALDDFGVGFSQLSYLLQFRFDELKIDRTFVSRIVTDRAARVIVASMITMARDLGLEVVAEGIEQPAQRDLVHRLGATYGQGYLFGEAGPLPR
jgi:EAL domain-containing protein (putative c-di-GMP-specific phosphodiesterase class I)